MNGDGNSELVAMFMSRWPVGAPTSPRGQLRVALTEAHRAAAAAWPGVLIWSERFVGHLAERADSTLPPLEALALLPLADLYLACACAQGDPQAVTTLLARFGPRLREVVAEIDADAAFVDQVMEELGTALITDDGPAAREGKVAQYRGRLPLAGWLEASARRRALTLKGQGKPFDDLSEIAAMERTDPARADHLRLRYPNGFGQAVTDGTSKALAALPSNDSDLVRWHLVDGQSLRKLAHIRGVNVNAVAGDLARTRDWIQRHIRDELTARTGLSAEDVAGVMRALFTRVNLGIHATLKVGRAPGPQR